MSFDMGRVVGRTFAPLKGNPVTFFGLAFILVGLPAAAVTYFQQQATLDMIAATQGGTPPEASWFTGYLSTLGLGVIVSILTSALLQGSLIHAAVAHYRGGKASIGESLGTGLKHILPIILISILLGLGIGLGFILLIIPGIFLLVKWIVAIPSQVVENTGVTGAFGRSWDLTKGNWWPIFGLLVLYMIITYIVGIVLAIPLGTVGAFTGDDPFAAVEAATSPAAIAVQVVIGAINGAIGAAGAAAIYYELRGIKDGIGAEEIGAVFD